MKTIRRQQIVLQIHGMKHEKLKNTEHVQGVKIPTELAKPGKMQLASA
jgi:hypothetical protein